MRTVRLGSTGDDVGTCQELLGRNGFPTDVDRVFGPNTERRVSEFQRAVELSADGICGPDTWGALQGGAVIDETPIEFSEVAAFFSEMLPQRYKLSGAQCPSNPPGVSLRADRIGNEWTNCCQFTAWLLGKAFESTGVAFRGSQWSEWMVSSNTSTAVPAVPGYGPGVILQWRRGSTAPGDGPWLCQTFTESGGHSLIVVSHDRKTDRVLTLEAAGSIDGAGWGGIGPLREVLNPGPDWASSVSQTWESRFGNKRAVHCVELAISPESVRSWLQEGV